MRRLSLILTIPFAIVIVIFAVTNQQSAAVNLWPFGIELTAPLYRMVLISFVIGFLVGAVVMWVSGGARRRRAWEAHMRITDLEQELQESRRREAKAAKTLAPARSSRIPSTELTQGPERPAA